MRTMKNALANLVQTAILNFKWPPKIGCFTLFRFPRLKRLDFGLCVVIGRCYIYILGYCSWVCVLYLGATDSGPRLP